MPTELHSGVYTLTHNPPTTTKAPAALTMPPPPGGYPMASPMIPPGPTSSKGISQHASMSNPEALRQFLQAQFGNNPNLLAAQLMHLDNRPDLSPILRRELAQILATDLQNVLQSPEEFRRYFARYANSPLVQGWLNNYAQHWRASGAGAVPRERREAHFQAYVAATFPPAPAGGPSTSASTLTPAVQNQIEQFRHFVFNSNALTGNRDLDSYIQILRRNEFRSSLGNADMFMAAMASNPSARQFLLTAFTAYLNRTGTSTVLPTAPAGPPAPGAVPPAAPAPGPGSGATSAPAPSYPDVAPGGFGPGSSGIHAQACTALLATVRPSLGPSVIEEVRRHNLVLQECRHAALSAADLLGETSSEVQARFFAALDNPALRDAFLASFSESARRTQVTNAFTQYDNWAQEQRMRFNAQMEALRRQSAEVTVPSLGTGRDLVAGLSNFERRNKNFQVLCPELRAVILRLEREGFAQEEILEMLGGPNNLAGMRQLRQARAAQGAREGRGGALGAAIRPFVGTSFVGPGGAPIDYEDQMVRQAVQAQKDLAVRLQELLNNRVLTPGIRLDEIRETIRLGRRPPSFIAR